MSENIEGKRIMIRGKMRLLGLASTLILALSNAYGDIAIEKGQVYNYKTDKVIGSVLIANKKVADYNVLNNHRVAVYAKGYGKTSYVVYDKSGKIIAEEKIQVVHSFVGRVEQDIAKKFPGSAIKLEAIKENIIANGTVPTSHMKKAIVDYIGKTLLSVKKEYKVEYKLGEDSDSSGSFILPDMTYTEYKNFIDNIKVISLKDQANVRVIIASVDRQVMQDIGITWSNIGKNGMFVLKNLTIGDISSLVSFLDQENVGSILAEPNLTVVSGKVASFFSGGEIPYATTSTLGQTTIQYKKYGINLNIALAVNAGGIIDLQLSAGMSGIDAETMTSLGLNSVVPLKASSITSDIQLRDGQSFIIGGLLNRTEMQRLEKIPFIGDIPLFGALFRHTHKEQKQNELIVIVTVNTVHPMNRITNLQIPSVKLQSSLKTLLAIDDNTDQDANHYLEKGGFDG